MLGIYLSMPKHSQLVSYDQMEKKERITIGLE